MKFLAYFGHLNIDVNIGVSSLPKPGEARGVTGLKEQFAGTAGNFAYVAHSLGLEFDLYSSVGGSTHVPYIEKFKELGISTEHVDIIPDAMGPICYIPSDGREQIAYMFQGPMNDWKPSVNFQYGTYKHINIGTGPVKEYIKIIEREKSADIIFDPGQEIWYTYSGETARYMVDHSHMLIMNRKEFEHLKEMTGLDEQDINRTVEDVIVTEGAEGAVLIQNGKSLRIPGYKAENINDTIGAGDSFRAGLYAALYRGVELKKAIKFGNITAAKAIENPISQFNLTYSAIYDVVSAIKV
ncbi:carbohydrate kinase family protein [Ferroplasma sp.]|uniref:carbohydrate kinase family protein n=1 Tax=Ferroplasma sp. TaxID=2591003 RepID=UPI002637B6B0|nr:carbohydrate kinase family protein [Ferroplasma sp.]MCL4453094.1 carbohydrate kinase family protein [Candidatus Thermoplasmatota archaeon]